MELSGQFDLELGILAILLKDERLEWVQIDRLDKELFFYKENKALYEKVMRVRLNNEPYDLVLVQTDYGFTVEELRRLMPMLRTQIHPLNWTRLYDALINQYYKLQAKELEEGKITHEEFKGNTEKFGKYGKKVELFNTQKNMSEYINDIDDIVNDRLKLYDLGYSNLMNLIGDIYEGNMLVVGGRTSMGKTSLMLRFAYNLAKQGKNILFYTSEMNRTQLMNRIISFVYRIKIQRGYPKDKAKELTDILSKLSEKINITIANTSLFSEKEIVDKLKETKADVIVLDYIQRFKIGNNTENRAAEFSNIANNIKSIALNNNILAIVGSQMNRAGDSKDLSALKESGGIEESCDVAILISKTKTKYTNKDGHEVESEMQDSDNTKNITLHVAKNRNGMTGEVKYMFIKEHCDFVEI